MSEAGQRGGEADPNIVARQLRKLIIQEGDVLFDRADDMRDIELHEGRIYGRYLVESPGEITEFDTNRIKLVRQRVTSDRPDLMRVLEESVDSMYIYKPKHTTPGLLYPGGLPKILIGRIKWVAGLTDRFAITNSQYLHYPDDRDLEISRDDLIATTSTDKELDLVTVSYVDFETPDPLDFEVVDYEELAKLESEGIEKDIPVSETDRLKKLHDLLINYLLFPQNEKDDM